VLTALVVTLAPTVRAEAADVHVPRHYFGLHDGSMEAYRHLDFGALRLWDSHVTWRDIETSPGVYDWSRLDAYVQAAQRHHTQVTLVLAMTPSFYSPASSLPPTDRQHFYDYVRAVMSRYRSFNGRCGIAAYQVWNEGNVPYFWSSTPHQLALMTRAVWRIHQHVDPDATIVAPSFAVRLRSQRQWLSAYERQRVAGRPVRHYYDANALSLYPRARYGSRTGGPEDAMRLLTMAKHRLALAGVPRSTPLWGTEVNYGLTGEPSAATAISERRQVANVIRTYVLGAARGLTSMFWYRYDWNNLPASSGGGTLGNTLLSIPGSPDTITRAGAALRTTQRWLRGRLVGRDGRQPCGRGPRGTYTCVVRYAGGVRRIMWNPERPVRVRFPHGAVHLQRVDGRTTRVTPRRSTLRVSYLPVVVLSPR
jgi:hypothetical protein